MRKALIFIIAISLFGFLIFSLGQKDQEDSNFWDCKNCNVVVIAMTSARPDHLSVYGYAKNTASSISRLAKDGIIFTNAFTQGSRTIAAGLSLLTSLYPYTHGVFDQTYSKDNLNSNAQSLTEILKEEGYKTAAFTGGGHYKRFYGFDKGFDAYEDSPDFTSFAIPLPKAIDWLKQNKKSKFFLFLQSFDAHCPYVQPAPYDRMFDPTYVNKRNIDFSSCYWSYKQIKNKREGMMLRKVVDDATQNKTGNTLQAWRENEVCFEDEDIQHLIALYDGSIAYADSQIQRILDELSELQLNKNTIIVFLGDHGELLGENGRFMRGGYLTGTYHDAVIHIPLIVKYPKMKVGKKVDGLAQTIDIAPTLLESLNIKSYKYSQGKSLLPLIKTGEKINEYVYGGTSQYRKKSVFHYFTGINEVNFIRNNEWKLIVEIMKDYDNGTSSENYELYNIKSDPGQLKNILEDNYLVAEDLRSRLKQWEKETKQPKDIDDQNKTNEERQTLIQEGRKRGYW